MDIFSGFFRTKDEGLENNRDQGLENSENKTTNADNQKLTLHREELDISKSRVDVGAVELSKEIIEEQKVVDVPVNHEEIVIERHAINNEFSDSPITDEQTIRIPVSEEQIHVGKHTVVTEEIEAYKREVQDTRHVEETLKREEAHINKEGNPRIIDKETDEGLH